MIFPSSIELFNFARRDGEDILAGVVRSISGNWDLRADTFSKVSRVKTKPLFFASFPRDILLTQTGPVPRNASLTATHHSSSTTSLLYGRYDVLEEEDSGGWWRWRGGFKIFLGHNVLTGAYYDMCSTTHTHTHDLPQTVAAHTHTRT